MSKKKKRRVVQGLALKRFSPVVHLRRHRRNSSERRQRNLLLNRLHEKHPRQPIRSWSRRGDAIILVVGSMR